MKFAPFWFLTFIGLISSASAFQGQPQSGDRQRFELTESRHWARPFQAYEFIGSAVVGIQKDRLTWISTNKSMLLPEGVFTVRFSRAGNYFLLSSLSPGENSQEKTLTLKIYRADGQELYQVVWDQFYDEPYPVLAISDRDGSVVLGRSTTGELFFYNNTGNLIRRHILFPDVGFDLERKLYLAYTKDGRTLFAAATARGYSPTEPAGTAPTLFRVDTNGEVFWSQPLPGHMLSQMLLSPDDQLIAAGTYSLNDDKKPVPHGLLVTATGKKLADLPILFKVATFSPDSKQLLLADNRTAWLLNTEEGPAIWNYVLPEANGIITAAAVSNDGAVAGLLIARSLYQEGGFVFTEPEVHLIAPDGSLMQRISSTEQVFDRPAFQISPDGGELMIGFKHTYQIYRAK